MKENIKKWRMIHLVISLAIVALTTIAYFYHEQNGALLDVGHASIGWEYAILLLLILSILIGQWVYRKQLKDIRLESDLQVKLNRYHKSLVILYAGIETGSMISLFAFVLSGLNNIFLYNMIFIVYLIYNRPNPMKFISDLKLNPTESEEVRSAFDK